MGAGVRVNEIEYMILWTCLYPVDTHTDRNLWSYFDLKFEIMRLSKGSK